MKPVVFAGCPHIRLARTLLFHRVRTERVSATVGWLYTPPAAPVPAKNCLVLFARRNRNIETHTDQPGDRDTARPRRCLSERRLRSTVLYPLPSASLTRSVSVGSHPETNPPRTRMMYYNREILKSEEQFKKYYSHDFATGTKSLTRLENRRKSVVKVW